MRASCPLIAPQDASSHHEEDVDLFDAADHSNKHAPFVMAVDNLTHNGGLLEPSHCCCSGSNTGLRPCLLLSAPQAVVYLGLPYGYAMLSLRQVICLHRALLLSRR